MNLEEFKAKKKKQKAKEEEKKFKNIQQKYKSGQTLTLSEFATLKGKEYSYKVPEMNSKSEEGWFKSGAFSDGYQFGDITKTVFGTVGDAGTNIVKGAGNLVEGVTDLGAYGVAGIADFMGADDFAEGTRNLAKKNSVNDALGGLESYFDKNSLLGNKSDNISQGLGYVGGILLTGGLGAGAGLGTAGTTALTTGVTFGSGMGGGMSEAYQSNATDEEALQYGLIKGAVEAGSELLFGGLGKTANAVGLSKGVTSIDDALAKKLSSKVTDQIAKNFIEYGVKASAEGLEEVIAGIGTAWAKHKTYMSDEEFSQILKDEQLLEQFVAGAVTSSIAQSGLVPGMKNGSLKEANQNGRDFITGYTQNEQTVIDKVAENRINEAEKDGNKLSNKEKGKIIEQVENDLKKGYIDIDSIEEALGGDSYDSYKTLSDEMDEYTNLNKMKAMELTGEQSDRLAELKKKNNTNSYESEKARLKQELSKNVSDMTVNDIYLRESYNEKARRGQKYTADVSKYDKKQQETIQRAIDSGILNDTNRTHEFVDMIAKVSADKGVSFNFTDNQKLKESGFALDGRTVNGFVEGKDITLNVNSAKALNKVVGHEITHVLKGTDLYSELQAAVKAYAETKGEYQSRYDALTELYKDQKADIEEELTADLVGDYLFTDEKFIKNFSAEQPNIFKKIFEEIKYLVKVATSGSKEAKQLEQVKRAFEKAYNESVKLQNDANKYNSVIKYSLNENAESELHKALYDKTYENEVLLRDETPPIILAHKGVKNLPMVMNASHIRENVFTEEEARAMGLKVDKSINYHGLGETFFLKVIDSLDDVDLAYRGTKTASNSSRRENYFLLISKLKDKTGQTVNVPVYINEHAKYNNVFIDTNKISTVFGRRNFDEYIKRQIASENLVRIKNRSNQPSESLAPIARHYRKDTSNDIVSQNTENTSGKQQFSLSEVPLQDRVSGDALIDAEDLMVEIGDMAEINENGYVTLYHRTSKENANNIRSSKKMSAKEDGIFFSTKKDGQNAGYGEEVVEFKIPIEKLVLDDIFDDEAHLRFPLKNRNQVLDVSDYLVDDNTKMSLSKDEDIAPIGNYNVYGKDIAFEAPTAEDIATSQEVSANEDINPPEVEDMAAVEDESTELSLTEKNKQAVKRLEQVIADTQATINELTAQYDKEIQALYDEYDRKKRKDTKAAQELLERADRLKAKKEKNLDKLNNKIKKSKEAIEKINEKWGIAVRKDANAERMKHIKSEFNKNGMDLDEVLDNAKNKSNLSSVDNTPQRFFEKSFGYKEGQLLSDLTINQVAKNETKAVRWLNSLLGKKEGKITNLSKKYGIKPKSKEDAAAQMYAEGFYLNDKGDYIKYGNAELAADFPDIDTQNRIKGLAKDPLVRKIYDDTLVAINESRERNGYTAVPRRENYYMHFIEEGGFLSRIGFPFNKDTMAEKNLPTDINGMTADLKPGQPYFANAQQRKGLRTTHSLLYGMEKYVTSAKDQIYHIDDIQTFRTLRNYIADRYGQAKGLENLDSMTEEEAEARIKEVFSGHLSVMAKFLNEQANHMAGKTALIDRAAEGLFGRRALSTLKQINNQVASNMVGLNIGSSLTNFISGVQAFAKGNKYDAVKAFCQTFSNKLNSINGKSDGFAEQNDAIVRRKGADSLYQTPWQKAQNIGFTLMSAVDDVTTEFIVRTKYNELTRKGMDSKQAHDEAGKWAMRILSDRSFGQMPQLYNSRMLGLWTKFQLEVRNQLDSMGYDTIKEAEANTEHIQEQSERNKVKAAKITSTMVQLAVFQHLFGKAFESVAGYNPTFDIVETLIKLFGMDDEDDSEDTAMDNLEQAFFELAGDLPYTSLIADGGRIPISSALPLEELYNGTDKYGNEKSRLKIIGEALPYYLMPTGYGQIKKSKQGLDMFDDDLPIAGSYTDSGSLRFAVEDTFANRVQAGIFGQWANKNAQDYIDNGRQTLKSNQIQELVALDLPMKDYWEYRDGLKEQKTLEDKFNYIADLDLPVSKKNIMINNIVQRDEQVDMSNYDDFSSYDEFDFYFKNQDKYEFLQSNGISYKRYKESDESKSAYDWAYKNPEKYKVSQVISADVVTYRSYASDINNITGDKDSDGNTINGSRKDKVVNYINELDIDYGAKVLLFKMEYPSDNTYNEEIVEYLNSREDISYQKMVTILEELGFTVESDGTVRW